MPSSSHTQLLYRIGVIFAVSLSHFAFPREFSHSPNSLSPASALTAANSASALPADKKRELTKIFDEWNRRYLEQEGHLSLSQRDIAVIDGVGGTKEFDYLKRILNLIYGPDALGLPDKEWKEWVESKEELQNMLALLEREKIISAEERQFLMGADDFFSALIPVFLSGSGFASFNPEEGKNFRVLPQRAMDDFLKECIRGGQLPGAAGLDDFELRTYFYSLYYENTSKVLTILARAFKDLAEKVIPPEVSSVEDGKIDDDFEVVERSGVRFSHSFGFINSPVHQISARQGISAEELFASQPEKILTLFYHSAAKEIRPSSEILEAARKAVTEHPQKFNTAKTRQDFLNILKLDSDVSYTLWRMNEIGLLSIIFPEFKNIKGLFTEPNHRLAVHTHTLYVLDTLEHLPEQEDPALQEVKDLFIETRKNPELILILRLSVLLHDSAKGKHRSFTAGHATYAAQYTVPQALAPFHTAFPVNVGLIQWLVRNHMQLNAISQSRYSQDTFLSGILDFANDPGLSLTGLNLLYLISYGDKLGVDPSRKIEILRAEHPSAIDRLDNTFHALRRLKESNGRASDVLQEWMAQQEKEKIAFHAKNENTVRQELKRLNAHLKTYFDSIPTEELKTEAIQQEIRRDFTVNFHALYRHYASQFSGYYLRSLIPEQMIAQIIFLRHMEVLKTKKLDAALAQFSTYQSGHETFLEILMGINTDHPGLLARMSGVLAANGINIVGAEINTPDGVIFDRFFGYRMTPADDIESFQQNLQRDLTMAIELGISIENIFARNGRVYRFDRVGGNVVIEPTRIDFPKGQVEEGKEASVMTIKTPDRIGLLHVIARVLSERYGINILKVSVKTYQNGALDEFVLVKTQPDGALINLNADEEHEINGILRDLLDRETIFIDDIARAARRKIPLLEESL